MGCMITRAAPNHALTFAGSTQASNTSAGAASIVRDTARSKSCCGALVVVAMFPFLAFEFLEIRVQPLEALLPEAAVVLEPARGGGGGVGLEPAARRAALSGTPHQARPLQHAQVLGNGRPGDREGLGQVADGAVAVGEPGQDGAARGVAEGGVDRVQAGNIGNHMVTNVASGDVVSRR